MELITTEELYSNSTNHSNMTFIKVKLRIINWVKG